MMTTRLRTRSGGRIDRSRPIRFTFDGKSYRGFAGDTLASALIANGVHFVNRSYKYHRPRGFLSAGAEEPNALFGISRGPGRFAPNQRATQVALVEGLEATSQNRWPSLAVDIGAINDMMGRFYSAGFYYKTFMGPDLFGKNWAWKTIYEPIVREAAGIGQPPKTPDPDAYAQYYEHCDVLVIGAGPAGLAAARAAAGSGAQVILCDEQEEMGGSLLAETRAAIDGLAAADWAAGVLADLRARANVRLMSRTQAFGYYAQNMIGLNEIVSEAERAMHAEAPRERMWQVRAKEVVIAAGAIERTLVFPDNDRPGVMLADAARTYLNRYGAKVGDRVVVATAHDSAYRAALDLKAAGVEVALIADLRKSADGPLPQAARAAGLRVVASAVIHGAQGKARVSGVKVSGAGMAAESVACDALLMCGGWTPSVHLYSQSRGKVVWDEARGQFLPGPSVQRERSAGACRGVFGLAAVLAEGASAGADAASRAGFPAPAPVTHNVENAPEAEGGTMGDQSPPEGLKAKAFVDFQNDVCAKDIRLAVQEGMRSIEHVKRYTTTGMATDQGKIANLHALAIAAARLGNSVPQVGLTTFRQPYTPVTFGVFAGANRGDLFDPVRKTAIHSWSAAQGAAFEDVGLWKRAWYYPRGREDMHAAVKRECRQVRASVGMFDASTLGKIEVVGPDASRFMELMYTNPWAKLEVGRCRYGLMLNEQGFIIDDGVIARMAADRFHVTTTTGGAPRVLNHMEDYLQTEFPNLKVWLTSTTEQWAVIAVQGPKARDLIAPFVEGIDLSREAMPHMSVREGRFCGVPTRLMRVSFTGELGFEINVPPDAARSVWEALWAAGQAYDVVAYGTESMHVMRAEKGYIIVGQDTDGTVTPDDAGMSWAVGKAKKDFVGKRSLARPDLVAAGRKQFVGLMTDDPRLVPMEGAQIVARADYVIGEHAVGHVTSAYESPALDRSIALAVIENGRALMGRKVFIASVIGSKRVAIPATVCDPVFVDKKGERLDG
jgi:sarcosine oxidase subunit alpha